MQDFVSKKYGMHFKKVSIIINVELKCPNVWRQSCLNDIICNAYIFVYYFFIYRRFSKQHFGESQKIIFLFSIGSIHVLDEKELTILILIQMASQNNYLPF